MSVNASIKDLDLLLRYADTFNFTIQRFRVRVVSEVTAFFNFTVNFTVKFGLYKAFSGK